MSSRLPRSSFRPSFDQLPSRIAPTVFAPPPPIDIPTTLPTMDVVPDKPTGIYLSSPLEMVTPSTII